MAGGELLQPTLHVEVQLKSPLSSQASREVSKDVAARLVEDYDAVEVGQTVDSFDGIKHAEDISCVEIADYTGPVNSSGYYSLTNVQLDVQSYVLKPERESDPRRRIKQPSEDEMPPVRILSLPNMTFNETWSSLEFEDALPACLLRYLVRMVDMMSRPDLNLSAFNWNRLCLLHGPPGSGKSTLCRALAQKLSIRLGNVFVRAAFAEINTNAMLSKYFGESGKQIGAMFEHIHTMCQDRGTLVCVVMDEVETIAGSRERTADSTECSDGLRATNQLLTALDRLRNLPNVIVLCTSNLIEAIDPAFLDRVDIKQFIPCPSISAIYNIFRSCLNELVRSNLVKSTESPSSLGTINSTSTFASTDPAVPLSSSPRPPAKRTRSKSKLKSLKPPPQTDASLPEPWNVISSIEQDRIPTLAEMKVRSSTRPDVHSPGERVWSLAQKCEGLSGRTLRRLPILGLAMYTWGGECSLGDAISALEKAVEQEIAIMKGKKGDVEMGGI